jgi:hypothetical protein
LIGCGFAFVAIGVAIALSPSARAEMLRRVLSSPLVEEGSDPDGCTSALSGVGGPPAWQVRVERLLLDGKALVETSGVADPNRFPLCIADGPVAKNAEIELGFVPHDGRVARAAGIVLRFADPQDYYVAAVDALAGSVRLLRVVNGERRKIAGRDVAVAAGKAHTLKVKALDDVFTVWLDGQLLFDANDAGTAAPGRFGIWSEADSLTSYGDLFIAVLD